MEQTTTVIKKKRRNKPVKNPRPDTWLVGPDPVLRDQRLSWVRARAQAKFRGEEWNLSWEDWRRDWAGRWHLRGRGRTGLMMVRVDHTQPWQWDNVAIVGRYAANTLELERRFERGYISQIPSRGIFDLEDVI